MQIAVSHPGSTSDGLKWTTSDLNFAAAEDDEG